MDTSDKTMIPDVFESRKRKILAELSIPDAEYTDLSPKGSVDEGIRVLINDINTLPGLVTTSSCAGRISVFLEGRKKQHQVLSDEQQRQFVPSGGKGAGKWLYVSHEPLKEDGKMRDKERQRLHELFGMIPGDGRPPGLNKNGQAPRLVRFSFEPMVGLSLSMPVGLSSWGLFFSSFPSFYFEYVGFLIRICLVYYIPYHTLLSSCSRPPILVKACQAGIAARKKTKGNVQQ